MRIQFGRRVCKPRPCTSHNHPSHIQMEGCLSALTELDEAQIYARSVDFHSPRLRERERERESGGVKT